MTAEIQPHRMYGLTLTEPWATLVAEGIKRIETRSWKTNKVLPIAVAIHAGKSLPEYAADAIRDRGAVQEALIKAGVNPLRGVDDYPFDWDEHRRAVGNMKARYLFTETRGMIIAYATIAEIVAFPEGMVPANDYGNDAGLGDFTAGRYGWTITNVEKVTPFAMTGHQQLWSFPSSTIPSARAYLAAHAHELARQPT